MSKFKVGDLVKVLSEKEIRDKSVFNYGMYGYLDKIGFNPAMFAFCGEIATVTRIDAQGSDYELEFLEDAGERNLWSWDEWMFEDKKVPAPSATPEKTVYIVSKYGDFVGLIELTAEEVATTMKVSDATDSCIRFFTIKEALTEFGI